MRPEAKTAKIHQVHPTYGLVVKGLSRLPVTEEIAGSNPVEPARMRISPETVVFLLCSDVSRKAQNHRLAFRLIE